jgi:NADH-quinone oxidoreductase subunit E
MAYTNDQISIMDSIIARYPRKRSAIMPLLHYVQSIEGYVTNEGIELIGKKLELATAEVTAVSTFYTQYKSKPVGEYHVGICTNTLCAVMGGDMIFDAIKEHLEIENNGVTSDGKVSVEHIECNAACDYAPVVMVNWEFYDNQTVESVKNLVDGARSGKHQHVVLKHLELGNKTQLFLLVFQMGFLVKVCKQGLQHYLDLRKQKVEHE